MMFGVPEVFCGDTREHTWHGDGTTFCGGVLGPVVEHDTFDQLDALACQHGVEGHTYPTGGTWPDPLRRAYAVIDGVLHTAPAVRTMTNAYPNPGAPNRRRYGTAADLAGDRHESRVLGL